MEQTFINQQTVAEEPRILRRHILDLLLPFVWSVLMLVPLALATLILNISGITSDPLGILGTWLFSGIYIVFVVSFFTTEWIFWYQDAWIITHDRLIDIQIVSLFNRRMSQLSFTQVQDVRVEIQGYLQNIFNYGTVYVQSAGRQGFFELHSIPRPSAIASEISDKSLVSRGDTAGGGEVKVIRPTQHLGELLIAEGKINQQDLLAALQAQAGSGKRLGQILLEENKITRQDLVQVLAGQYRIPGIDLSRYDVDGNIVRLIPYDMAAKHTAVAIDRSPDGVISIAMAQPSPERIGEFMAQFDSPLTFLVADEDYINEVIAGYYPQADSHGQQLD